MTESGLILGLVSTSSMENEWRLPVHPDHFSRFDRALRNRIFVEDGYGDRFGADRKKLSAATAGMVSREELFKRCDVILLPKPIESDFHLFREGQILWGWPHCVQGRAITQVGIDKKMTYIAWEAMYSWKNERVPGPHTFYKNNELAGYCGVLHSLQLKGITGHYGVPGRAAVISVGSTARGAVQALQGRGYTDITVYTRRSPEAVDNKIPAVRYRQIKSGSSEVARVGVDGDDGQPVSMAEELAGYNIIVNCILQDTNCPLMFIKGAEVECLRPGTLIIDVSCDRGMGFDFARPTSFERPTFQVGQGVTYYAVDHTPSYLWDTATYEISSSLFPYINSVMGGEEAWMKNLTIAKAIEIRDGVVLNPKILRFQNRANEYPHLVKKGDPGYQCDKPGF